LSRLELEVGTHCLIENAIECTVAVRYSMIAGGSLCE
jgi:hypothetical protein